MWSSSQTKQSIFYYKRLKYAYCLLQTWLALCLVLKLISNFVWIISNVVWIVLTWLSSNDADLAELKSKIETIISHHQVIVQLAPVLIHKTLQIKHLKSKTVTRDRWTWAGQAVGDPARRTPQAAPEYHLASELQKVLFNVLFGNFWRKKLSRKTHF